jgi:hypothetical protein
MAGRGLPLSSIENCDHKGTMGHKAAVKLIAEAENEAIENLCLKM